MASTFEMKGHTEAIVVSLVRSKERMSGELTMAQAPKWLRHSVGDAAGPASGA